MRNRRPRMFRSRSNGRNFRHRSDDDRNMRLIPGSFSNARVKSNFKSHQSAEQILEGSNLKFESRMAFIEEALIAQGKTLKTASLAEMDELWGKSKQKEDI